MTTRRIAACIIAGAGLVIMMAVTHFVDDPSRTFALVTSFCLLGVVIALQIGLRDFWPDSQRSRWLYISGVVLFAMMAWIGVWRRLVLQTGNQKWGIFSILVLLATLSLLTELARRRMGGVKAAWAAYLSVSACALLSAFGLWRLTNDVTTGATAMLVVGVLLSPIALSFIAEAALRALAGTSRSTMAKIAVGGAVIALLGLSDLSAFGSSPHMTFILAIALGVLMGSIVINLPLDAVVALLVFAGTVPYAPLPSVTPPARPAVDQPTFVSLGDSYASGEGAEQYFTGSNVQGFDTCRRAPTAYPVRVSSAEERGLVFLACSGAKTKGGSHFDLDEQIDLLPGYGDLEGVELVFFDAGGNDALFSTIGTVCLGPGNCADLREPVMRELDLVGPKLEATYADLQATVADLWGDVPIAVVPYPIPIAPSGCSWSGFSDAEHQFLYDFTSRLNDIVETEVAAAGLLLVRDVENSFDGTRICDSDDPGEASVNFFALTSVEGLLHERANPKNWTHNSLHPTADGHRRMSEAFLAWHDRFERGEEQPAVAPEPVPDPEPAPPDDPNTGFLTPCGGPVGGTDETEAARLRQCQKAMTAWATQRGVDLFLRVLIPVAMLIGGLFIMWVALVARRRAAADVAVS